MTAGIDPGLHASIARGALLLACEVPGEPVAKGRPRLTTQGGHPRAYTPARTEDNR